MVVEIIEVALIVGPVVVTYGAVYYKLGKVEQKVDDLPCKANGCNHKTSRKTRQLHTTQRPLPLTR